MHPQAVATMDRDLRLTVGKAEVLVIPSDGAGRRAEYLVSEVSYENVSGRPIWVTGWSPEHPACFTDTRVPGDADWVSEPLMCGTGLTENLIAPAASHSCKVYVPMDYLGRELRVSLTYSTTPTLPSGFPVARPCFIAQSAPQILAPASHPEREK